MRTSTAGMVALAIHEGIVPAPYRDSVGVWTYGIGHTASAGPPDPATMSRGMPDNMLTAMHNAVSLFHEDILKYERRVNDAVRVPMAQHEFDAMVSFDYNTGGINRARLTRLMNAGDRANAADAFMGWLRPPEIRGRREAERNLFRTGVYPNEPIPVWRAYPDGRRGGRVATVAPEVLFPELGTPTWDIRKWQEMLTAASFDPGPVDGIDGPRTRAAMEKARAALIPSLQQALIAEIERKTP